MELLTPFALIPYLVGLKGKWYSRKDKLILFNCTYANDSRRPRKDFSLIQKYIP